MERLPSKSFSYNSSTARRSFEKYFCKYYEHHSKEIIINYIKKLVYLDYVDYHFFRESIKIQLKGENYIIVNDNAMFNGIYNNKIPQNKNISIFILLYRLLIMVIKSISHLIITIRTKNKVKSKPIIFLRKKPYSDLGLFSILKKYIKKNNQDCIGLIYRFNKEGFYNEFIYLNKITGVAFLIIKATMQTIFTVIIYYKDIFRKVPNMYFTRIVNDIYLSNIIVSLPSKIITGVLVDRPIYQLLYKFKFSYQKIISLNESFWYLPIESFDYNYFDIYYHLNEHDKKTININGGKINEHIKVPFYRKDLIIPSNGISKDLNELINKYSKTTIIAPIQVPEDQCLPWARVELNSFILASIVLAEKNPDNIFIIKGKKGELNFLDKKTNFLISKTKNIHTIFSIKPRLLKYNQFEDIITKADLLISMSHMSTTIWQAISSNVPAIAINDIHPPSFLNEYSNFEIKLDELSEAYDYWINLSSQEWSILRDEIMENVNIKDANGLEFIASDLCDRLN